MKKRVLSLMLALSLISVPALAKENSADKRNQMKNMN